VIEDIVGYTLCGPVWMLPGISHGWVVSCVAKLCNILHAQTVDSAVDVHNAPRISPLPHQL